MPVQIGDFSVSLAQATLEIGSVLHLTGLHNNFKRGVDCDSSVLNPHSPDDAAI
jgi:hypothetical protein